jgi:hypothetical protein
MANEYTKVVSNAATYTGVQATIRVPDSWTVPASNDFINFYIGFGDLVEAGISWGFANGAWHYFLNGAGQFHSTAFNPQPTSGTQIRVKLVNNGNGNVSFYVNDVLAWSGTNGSLGSQSKVKQVIAAHDNIGDWMVDHSQVPFSQVKVRLANGTWVDWDSSIAYTGSHTSRYGTPTNPLSGDLDIANPD